MNTDTIESEKTGALAFIKSWVDKTLGLAGVLNRAEQEALELTERWDVPQGENVPADLRDTQPRYWLTRNRQSVAGRLGINDMLLGSQSASAPILLALFPVLAALASLASAVAPWLGLLPLLLVAPLLLMTWQATNSWLWPLLAVVLGVVMPLGGASIVGGFSGGMSEAIALMAGFVIVPIIAAVLMGSQNFMETLRKTLGGMLAFAAIAAVSIALPPALAHAAWFAIGCALPVYYSNELAKQRALGLMVQAKKHQSEILAGHATAHVAARKHQAEAAEADKSPVLKLGVATGMFSQLRDNYAPDAGLPFVVSAGRDMTTHLIAMGSTGTGKTSCVIRPMVKQWLAAAIGGIFIMDGKGGLAGEFRDLPNYILIEPGHADVALLQGLTPRDALMCLSAQSGGGSKANESEKFFVSSGREMLRHGLVLLDVVVRYEKSVIADQSQRQWRWALHDVFELLVRMQRASKEQESKAGDLLNYIANAEEFGRGGLLDDAINYFTNLPVGPDETRSNIWATVQSWLSPIMSDERLLPWAKLEEGADVTEALRGGAVGVCLPAFSYGDAGKQVAKLLKQRLFVELRRRASRDGLAGRPNWRDQGEFPMLMGIDEAQELVTEADVEMLPVARSLGCVCLYATQNVDSFFDRFGVHGANKLLDSFRSRITFQSSEATFKWAQEALGHVRVLRFPVRAAAIGYAESVAAAVASPLFDPTHPGAPLYRTWLRAGAGAIEDARRGDPEGNFGGHVGWRSNAAIKGGAAMTLPCIAGGVWEERPLLNEATYAAATAQPFTAVAQVMRGGVPRRDVIRLTPDFG
jgi:hypothetical protein